MPVTRFGDSFFEDDNFSLNEVVAAAATRTTEILGATVHLDRDEVCARQTPGRPIVTAIKRIVGRRYHVSSLKNERWGEVLADVAHSNLRPIDVELKDDLRPIVVDFFKLVRLTRLDYRFVAATTLMNSEGRTSVRPQPWPEPWR